MKNLICQIFILFYLLLIEKIYSMLDNCALLGYYSASSGNFLPTFRDPWICGPETSVRNYYYSLRNNPEERRYLLRSVSLISRLFCIKLQKI